MVDGGQSIGLVMGIIVLGIVAAMLGMGFSGEFGNFLEVTGDQTSVSDCEYYESRSEEPGDTWDQSFNEEECDEVLGEDLEHGGEDGFGSGPGSGDGIVSGTTIHEFQDTLNVTEDEEFSYSFNLDDLQDETDHQGKLIPEIDIEDNDWATIRFYYPDPNDEEEAIEVHERNAEDYCDGPDCGEYNIYLNMVEESSGIDNEDDLFEEQFLDCDETSSVGSKIELRIRERDGATLSYYVLYESSVTVTNSTGDVCWE